MAWFYRFSLGKLLPFQLIGTEQGFLPAPVQAQRVVMAPAERVDLVFDFAAHAGENILLRSDAFDIMQFRVAAKGAPRFIFSSSDAADLCKNPGEPGSQDAASYPGRAKGSDTAIDGDAVEQYSMAHARDREAGAEHHRDLGVGESDR